MLCTHRVPALALTEPEHFGRILLAVCREKQARKQLEAQHAATLTGVQDQLEALRMTSAGHQFKETALRAKIGRRDEKIQALQKVMKERDERWRQRLLPYLEAAGADPAGADGD